MMNINTICWRYMPHQKIGTEAYIDLMTYLEANGEDITASKTCKRDWNRPLAYHEDRRGKYSTVYVSTATGDTYDRLVYQVNLYDIEWTGEITAAHAGHVIRSMAADANGGRLLRSLLGLTRFSEFKKNIPKAVYFSEKKITRADGVHGIDMSSAYPWAASLDLPTTAGRIIVDGEADPCEEYPFAFYSNGMTAVFGEYDERKRTSMLVCDVLANTLKPRGDIGQTVLMKSAGAVLAPVFEDLYRRKLEGDREAKGVMNIGIGTLQRNPANFIRGKKQDLLAYYHACAVVRARVNAAMQEAALYIRSNGGVILQAIVDGIVYKGDIFPIFGNPKGLGRWTYEFKNGRYFSTGAINRYAVEDGAGQLLKVACAGEKGYKVEKGEDIFKYAGSF